MNRILAAVDAGLVALEGALQVNDLGLSNHTRGGVEVIIAVGLAMLSSYLLIPATKALKARSRKG